MKACIIGCGQIADAHIQQIGRIPGAAVEAVCDLNPHMAEQAATRFRVPRHYTDASRMLAEVGPDVVHITTPPGSHLALGRQVVEHGAHAYIEKPFTVDVREAEELVTAAEGAGRLLCVGHNNAFDPAFLRLRQAFDEGSLGGVVHVEAVMGYNLAGPFGSVIMREPGHWIHRLPGGLPQNNISHPVSLVLPFLPDEDLQVRALGFRRRPQRFGDARDGFFDELRVHLWARTATASLTFSCHARPAQLYVTVFGTAAQATASVDGRSLRIVKGSALPGPFARLGWLRQDQRQAGRQLWAHVRDLATAHLHSFESLHELVQRFYRAIEGRADAPVPMREAVRATRVIDEIFARMEDGDRER